MMAVKVFSFIPTDRNKSAGERIANHDWAIPALGLRSKCQITNLHKKLNQFMFVYIALIRLSLMNTCNRDMEVL